MNTARTHRGPRAPRPRRVAFVALLLVALVGGPAVVVADGTPTPSAAAATRLFLVDEDGRTLRPVDPETLADLPAARSTTVAGPPADLVAEGSADDRFWHWQLSADGSTLVGVDFAWFQEEFEAEDVTFVVRDVASGAERARFHPPALVVTNLMALSRDGSRLVLRGGWVYDDPDGGAIDTDPQVWYALDTANGRVIATVTADERGSNPGGAQAAGIDPDARRLYRLVVAPGAPDPGPWPTHLVANDLTTGAEIGRLDLPDVQAGGGPVGPTVDGFPVDSYLRPGLAVSPDGRRVVVAHADGTGLTLIDPERLTRERLVPLPAPTRSGSDPIATPSSREEMNGVVFETRVQEATFAPDGRGLYLAGSETTVDAAERMTCRSLPLRRVDLTPGGSVTGGPSVVIWQPVASAPDGGGLYAVAPTEQSCVSSSDTAYTLLRLDPTTLAPLAQREVRGLDSPGLLLLPPGTAEP